MVCEKESATVNLGFAADPMAERMQEYKAEIKPFLSAKPQYRQQAIHKILVTLKVNVQISIGSNLRKPPPNAPLILPVLYSRPLHDHPSMVCLGLAPTPGLLTQNLMTRPTSRHARPAPSLGLRSLELHLNAKKILLFK